MAQKIELLIRDEDYKEIEGRAKRAKMDVNEYVLTSVGVMNALQDEKKDKSRIYIGTNDTVYKELRVP
jgi:hypothetical protein